MPFLKPLDKPQPLWKEWDQKANKKGLHKTVYSVIGDEYVGEWLDNKRSGKGTFKWVASGALYDGDWKNGVRCGFGTYSVKRPDGTYMKEYSGGWKNDKKHGSGTQFYSETEFYEGEWYAGKRHGWGRMYYADGSIYEGEWCDDQRGGTGTYRTNNNNRYEGSWKNGKKNGPGRFYYGDTGQVYDGMWVDDCVKCGEMKDYDREVAPVATQYPIPSIELAQPDNVVAACKEAYTSTDDW